MKEPDVDKLSPELLDKYRAALLANAMSLYLDARLLLNNQRYARATSLGILCSEELAKLFPIWVVRALGALPPQLDVKQVRQMFTNHTHKLILSDILMRMSPAAWGDGIGDMLERLNQFSAEVVADDAKAVNETAFAVNDLKKRGLYVSWSRTSPSVPTAPDTSVQVKDANAMVNHLIGTVGAAHIFDAIVTILATSAKKPEDVPQELIDRLMADVRPVLERLKVDLKSRDKNEDPSG